ncbi:MAG TPA: tRNA pseudouridine(55) synthase TruB [Usitatibacteraceae bacterium]
MSTKRRALTGVLLLDKPAGLSSTSALGRARWIFQAEKAGHTGTLDPFATGLLPICFGEAAKFARFMLDADKGYRATLKLGERTPTGDTESTPCELREVNVDEAKIRAVLATFLGPQTQIPPMHSALKQGGVPLYKLARKGIEVERAARAITIDSLEFVSLDGQQLVIDTRVSKGSYIRVLAEDIGEALGCGAHLTALRRTSTGGFSLADASTLEELEGLAAEQRDGRLRAPDALCPALPAITLDAVDSKAFGHGQVLAVPDPGSGEFRVYAGDGRFLGIGTVAAAGDRATLTPLRLMSGA